MKKIGNFSIAIIFFIKIIKKSKQNYMFIDLIAGARPNFMKIAPIIDTI